MKPLHLTSIILLLHDLERYDDAVKMTKSKIKCHEVTFSGYNEEDVQDRFIDVQNGQYSYFLR